MKIFIDTANLNEIRKAKALGLVDGVTTNPTLLAKEGEKTETLIRKIWQEVRGPVNVEVTGTLCDDMVKEAREMAAWGEEIVIKIPINLEGLKTEGTQEIRADGTVVLTDNAYQVQKKLYGMDMREFKFADMDDIGKELRAIAKKLIAKYS